MPRAARSCWLPLPIVLEPRNIARIRSGSARDGSGRQHTLVDRFHGRDVGPYSALTLRLDGASAPQLRCRFHSCGGVAERLKAAVLKTAGPQGLAGSNPASSASRLRSEVRDLRPISLSSSRGSSRSGSRPPCSPAARRAVRAGSGGALRAGARRCARPLFRRVARWG